MQDIIKPYRQLHEKVQDNIARYLRSAMHSTFDVLATMRDYKQMLHTVNPDVRFYITEKGEKLFDVIDDNQKLSSIMGENLASAAKWDQRIMDSVLKHSMKVK